MNALAEADAYKQICETIKLVIETRHWLFSTDYNYEKEGWKKEYPFDFRIAGDEFHCASLIQFVEQLCANDNYRVRAAGNDLKELMA